jgi:hypothetical protein
MIYEQAARGTVRLAYDFPSSLMSRLDTKSVAGAASKLGALAERAAGAAASSGRSG